jgi:hypothetical protein
MPYNADLPAGSGKPRLPSWKRISARVRTSMA